MLNKFNLKTKPVLIFENYIGCSKTTITRYCKQEKIYNKLNNKYYFTFKNIIPACRNA